MVPLRRILQSRCFCRYYSLVGFITGFFSTLTFAEAAFTVSGLLFEVPDAYRFYVFNRKQQKSKSTFMVPDTQTESLLCYGKCNSLGGFFKEQLI